jgi:hypothetical protein
VRDYALAFVRYEMEWKTAKILTWRLREPE